MAKSIEEHELAKASGQGHTLSPQMLMKVGAGLLVGLGAGILAFGSYGFASLGALVVLSFFSLGLFFLRKSGRATSLFL